MLVQVIAGGDKGKVGTIQAVDTKRGMVVVEGVNIKVRERAVHPGSQPRLRAGAQTALCTSRLSGPCLLAEASAPFAAATTMPAALHEHTADQAREAGRSGGGRPDCEEGVPGAPLQRGCLQLGAAGPQPRGLQVSAASFSWPGSGRFFALLVPMGASDLCGSQPVEGYAVWLQAWEPYGLATRPCAPSVLCAVPRSIGRTRRLAAAACLRGTFTLLRLPALTACASLLPCRVVDGKKVRFLKKTGEVLPERTPERKAADSSK